MSAQTQTLITLHHTPIPPSPRRLVAARRRATEARARADRNPTTENLNAAAELEAGYDRRAGQVPA